MGSFAGTNHPMYILYPGSKMKVETLVHTWPNVHNVRTDSAYHLLT